MKDEVLYFTLSPSHFSLLTTHYSLLTLHPFFWFGNPTLVASKENIRSGKLEM